MKGQLYSSFFVLVRENNTAQVHLKLRSEIINRFSSMTALLSINLFTSLIN